ncbi:MAG: AAA family ATPase [Dermatophilaceae bacterium]
MGRAPVWVVAGPPGAGKSTVASLLLERLSPTPAILDKDVLFAGFVREVQAAHGRGVGEREGAWYDAHVKAHEYAGMTAAAAQIRAAGAPVMLVGPFTTAIRDRSAWAQWVAQLGGEPMYLVWVGCREVVLRDRIMARDSRWDDAKLASWDEFVARQQPTQPPPVRHTAIDNSGDLGALVAQITRVVVDRGW